MKRFNKFLAGILAALLLIIALPVAAEEQNEPTTASAEQFIAREHIIINEPVDGDVFANAQKLVVKAPVHGDVWALIDEAIIEQPVDGNIYILGESVTINSEINGNVYLAAGSITFGEAAILNGRVYAGTRTADLSGKINSRVYIRSVFTQLNAALADSGYFFFNDYAVGDEATFGRDMYVYGTNSSLDGLAEKTAGEVHDLGASDQISQEIRKMWVPELHGFSLLLKFFQILVIGSVFIALWPRSVMALMAASRKKWYTTWLWGMAAVLMIPLIAMLLLVSLIGIPLAVMVLMAYFIILLVAKVLFSLFLGHFLLEQMYVKRNMKPADAINLWHALLAGTVATMILLLIPYIGPVFSVFVFGFGCGLAVHLIKNSVEINER